MTNASQRQFFVLLLASGIFQETLDKTRRRELQLFKKTKPIFLLTQCNVGQYEIVLLTNIQ